MNREQKRKLLRKMNKITDLDFKRNLFRSLLTSCGSDIEEWFHIDRVVSTRVYNVMLPSSINRMTISNPGFLDKISHQDAIKMAFIICTYFAKEIDSFLKLKEQYENYIFRCQYLEATKILDDIENKCGISLWICGQKMVLEEEQLGLEGNKKLLEKYIGKAHRNLIVSTLLNFLSYRAEKGSSLNNYNEKVDKYLKNFENDKMVYSYFEYKLKIQDIDVPENISIILQVDSQTSVIDLYCSLIEILQRMTVNRVDLSTENTDRLMLLNKKIKDYRINNILLFGGNETPVEFNKDVIMMVEEYSVQNYHSLIEHLSSYLEVNPNDYQMWILLIKAHILYNTTFSCENQIINDMSSLYSLDNDCVNARNRLFGALKKYSDTSWHYKLSSLVTRKLRYAENSQRDIQLSLLNERTISPLFISLLPASKAKESLFEKIKNQAPISSALLNVDKETYEFPYECFRTKLYQATSLAKLGNIEEAYVLLNSISEEESNNFLFVKEKIIRLKYELLCKMKKDIDAIRLIVDAYFENENLIKRCDLISTYEHMHRTHKKEIFAMVDYPIFIYLSNSLDIKMHRIALSNYLDTNGINNSVDMIDYIDQYDIKSIFLFENICTLDVIKRDIRLAKTATEASDVRIMVLQKLIEYNPSRQEDYLSEISWLTTKREINNRIHLVSQRKVFVDVERIKQEKQELFEEDFQKYLMFKSFNKDIEGFDVTDETTIFAIKQIVNSMNEDIKQNILYSQTIIALKDLIADITYEFVHNEHYGLDTFLSSRIRHGYCKSQLTKELREFHLMLTTLDDESPNYNVYQFWDDKVNVEEENDYGILKNSLSEFTRSIEEKIQEIRRKWIRVRLSKDEVGMFDYTSFVSSMLIIDKQNIIDFDLMYNNIIFSLWNKTNESLSRIRDRINTELKSFYYEKLDVLEYEVKKLENSSVKGLAQELSNNITMCRAKISTIMSEFANIFYKDDVVYEDYTLNDLITTCMGIEKQIHVDFEDAIIEANAKGNVRLSGSSFSYFVEIIIMLLNNAVSHAGYSSMKDIELSLNICMDENDPTVIEIVKALANDKRNWMKENLLVTTVKNNLSPEKDIETIRLKVAEIFEYAKDAQKLKYYSTIEGGSGLYKIYKTINYNMSVPYVILYSVEEGSFSLTLAVDASNLITKERA